MRKFIMAILIAALALTAAACGEEPVKEASAAKAGTPAATATATVEPASDTDGDGINDADDPDPYVSEDDSTPTEDEVYTEEDEWLDEEDAEPTQTVRSVNQWGTDEGMKVKVTSMDEVSSIAPAPPAWLNDGVSDKPGSKLIAVKVDVKNMGRKSIDPLCGGGSGFVLLDEADRNFTPLDKLLDLNNNICGDGIQPGFKSSYTIAYRIPNGSEIGGLIVWNSESDEDYDGELSELLFTL